ncbi:MAG: lipocalin family protein [Lentisphaeria bacterium]|nr:lipocalin family protein [Lentisphaeria bacterium]
MKKNIFWCISSCIMILCGCQDDPGIPAVKNFQLERYMGKWYEIARLPNRFECGMRNVSTVYTLQKNGMVKVFNHGIKGDRCINISGYAKPAGNIGSGDLKVSFFRPFYGMYRIIKLAPDYSYSIVVGGSRDYLWILGRKPELFPAEKQNIIEFLHRHRFPVDELIWSWQSPVRMP